MLGLRSILLAAVVLSAPAYAQQAIVRDLNVEQTAIAQVAPPRPSSLSVNLSFDRADGTYAVGETVRLFVTPNEEAYVTVLSVGPTGQVTQLFPNAYQTENRLYPGRTTEIAGAATGARVTAAGPVGAELIKVIASNKPLVVVAEGQLEGRGAFRTVVGGVKSLSRDLQVVSNQATAPETKITFANFGLYTVASRQAPAQTVVVLPAGQGAVAPAPQAPQLMQVPAQRPFPLLIASDKSAYRIGEQPTIAVTTVQACNLTVLDVASNGQMRVLFPQNAASNALAAMQTVFISGGSAAPIALAATPGPEQIVAICSTTPTPAPLATVVVPQQPQGQPQAPDAERAMRERNLVVSTINEAAATTATATLVLTIQP